MKKLPIFTTEEQEREFWASHDSTDYIDWTSGEQISFPNLKPSLKTISLRLPEAMLETLKRIANKRDIPYQSLLKMFLAERLKDELKMPQTRGRVGTPRKRAQRTPAHRGI
jgi:predicted DNA binding CopG/RHH family protein